MKERPILFSAPMVRAILAGTKIQTRRVVKPQPPVAHNFAGFTTCSTCAADVGKAVWGAGDVQTSLKDAHRVACPYGQPGDLLWVRETWAHVPSTAYRCSANVQQAEDPTSAGMASVYAAGWERSTPGRWRPSIHMPRWASRITLEVTGVRVERLQDMEGQAPYPGESDALAEGVHRIHHGDGAYYYSAFRDEPHPNNWNDPTDAYRELWEMINAPGSWNANPWVWVVEFKRVTQ